MTCFRRHEALFQSTPSVWRETDFVPTVYTKWLISIHSLRVEGDGSVDDFEVVIYPFQSTPSVWRETHNFRITFLALFISIHSLRVEGD